MRLKTRLITQNFGAVTEVVTETAQVVNAHADVLAKHGEMITHLAALYGRVPVLSRGLAGRLKWLLTGK